jgi:hypothetical protein
MGETQVLPNFDNGNANLLLAQQATLAQSATLQSLSFYVTNAAGSLILGVYDANGPNGGPGTKLAETAAFTPTVGWNTANVLAPLTLPVGKYWLTYLPSNSSLAFRKGPVASGVPPSRYYTYAFGALPASFGTSTSSTTSHWSLYGTLAISSTVDGGVDGGNPGSSFTIGETNVLSNDDNGNANLLLAQQATLGQAATLQSLSFYVTNAAGSLVLGVYDSAGPSGGPGTKKAQTAAFTPVVGWNTASVTTPVALAAGSYWLAYLSSDNGLAFRKAPVASGVPSSTFYSYSFGNMPSTFSTTPSTTTSHWSLYGTMLTSGGGGGGDGGVSDAGTPGPDGGPVGNALAITSSALPNGSIGQAYSTVVQVTGGTPPYAWSVTSGALPIGFSLNTGLGTLSGTPSAGGAWTFTLTVQDSLGKTASHAFTLTVPHQVALSWTASTTAGVTYKVYRGTAHLGPYSPIASGLTNTSYTDPNVQSGQSYYYVCSAVDGSGTESDPSGETVAAIPNP